MRRVRGRMWRRWSSSSSSISESMNLEGAVVVAAFGSDGRVVGDGSETLEYLLPVAPHRLSGKCLILCLLPLCFLAGFPATIYETAKDALHRIETPGDKKESCFTKGEVFVPGLAPF